MSVLISFLGILSLSKFSTGCSWIFPLRHVVMVMRGLICQCVVLSACMTGLCLVAFMLWALIGNLSWQ